MSEVWRCPDCAEDVDQGLTVCPYCGYTAQAATSAATKSTPAAKPAATGTVATRTVRYGHCPSCGRSRWEGSPSHCYTCGAELLSLQTTRVPLEGPGQPGSVAATGASAAAGASTAAPSQAASRPVKATAPVPATAGAPMPAMAGSKANGVVAAAPKPDRAVASAPKADKAAMAAVAPVARAIAAEPTESSDGIALLRQLAALRDDGIISAREFETKKAEVLRRL